MRPGIPDRTAQDYDAVLAFPRMHVGIRTAQGAVTDIVYLPATVRERAPCNALAERAARQVQRYREDPDTVFDLPLAPGGTGFRRRVWAQISAIPRGRTCTYGEIARQLASSARAVGQACGDNPLPIVVPCHRVVAADGLGGFSHHGAGYLIEAKRWLLQHEGALPARQEALPLHLREAARPGQP